MMIQVISVEVGENGRSTVLVDRGGKLSTYSVLSKDELLRCVREDISAESDCAALKALVGTTVSL